MRFEWTTDLGRFKVGWFFSMITNEEYSVCPGMGYEHDKMELLNSAHVRIEDCYKKIITDLCDYSQTWTGYETKWLDECR